MDTVIIRYLGQVPYAPIYQAMQTFTNERTAQTPDELWFLEHHPIYTLGQAGKTEHLLDTGTIPVQPIDRGGQVTYHGLGQLVVYILMDLKRHDWGIRQLVTALEQAVIDYLALHTIHASRREKAPGVYVNDRKIAALGLRVRHGCSYHGLSFNINMDLSPFNGINPCGYPDLQVTQLADFGITDDIAHVSMQFAQCLCHTLNYTPVSPLSSPFTTTEVLECQATQ
ncbi:lipoyl(octanoyl) transferase LipB [Beggiatoa leptomitoformis]|uniref:Octanoyltransferase n=1 Tax=Beggiatoa leptomitoformis TaxID=288004 RepID=A0A2N9YB54_9GAMM|nr:lipoyl(octanoyl) transferase LipB [Beggiatoa leptomitoformis]ALG66958.1 lipoyl(octanoyl) transferase LipB [Beggiatoa leptomitoformis]AUI67672.1 lipoyl(octanoyl) transferase LipB [Beggiatoa leptomitoformis]